jgi:mono/diheme cytochrome c family protein
MTRVSTTCLAALFAGVLSHAAHAQTPAAGAAPTGNPDAGRRLFTAKSCYMCHGTEGQGGVPYPRIARVQRGQDNFIRYVRRPARMAAYSEAVLSDAELADIYAFLRSLPAPAPVDEIPLLKQMRRAQK